MLRVDSARKLVLLDGDRELPCDQFLGIPKNRAPDVAVATGMTEDGWVQVNPRTLETKYPGVYAVGDLAATGAPKAGAQNPGYGTCYVEFGNNQIGRVDVDFFGGPKPTGTFYAPSELMRADKHTFGAERRARWFGRVSG